MSRVKRCLKLLKENPIGKKAGIYAKNCSGIKEIVDYLNKQEGKHLVEIYGRHTCPYCNNADELLKNCIAKGKCQGIFYEINGEVQKLLNKRLDQAISKLSITKRRQLNIGRDGRWGTVPIVFLDGKFIGGYSELKMNLRKHVF